MLTEVQLAQLDEVKSEFNLGYQAFSTLPAVQKFKLVYTVLSLDIHDGGLKPLFISNLVHYLKTYEVEVGDNPQGNIVYGYQKSILNYLQKQGAIEARDMVLDNLYIYKDKQNGEIIKSRGMEFNTNFCLYTLFDYYRALIVSAGYGGNKQGSSFFNKVWSAFESKSLANYPILFDHPVRSGFSGLLNLIAYESNKTIPNIDDFVGIVHEKALMSWNMETEEGRKLFKQVQSALLDESFMYSLSPEEKIKLLAYLMNHMKDNLLIVKSQLILLMTMHALIDAKEIDVMFLNNNLFYRLVGDSFLEKEITSTIQQTNINAGKVIEMMLCLILEEARSHVIIDVNYYFSPSHSYEFARLLIGRKSNRLNAIRRELTTLITDIQKGRVDRQEILLRLESIKPFAENDDKQSSKYNRR